MPSMVWPSARRTSARRGKRTGFSFSMPTLRVWVTRMLLKRSTVRPGNWSASPKMTRQADRSAGSRTVLR